MAPAGKLRETSHGNGQLRRWKAQAPWAAFDVVASMGLHIRHSKTPVYRGASDEEQELTWPRSTLMLSDRGKVC